VLEQREIAHPHHAGPAEDEERDGEHRHGRGHLGDRPPGHARTSIKAVIGAVIVKVTTSTDTSGSSVKGSE
jgi:hypothetical protein